VSPEQEIIFLKTHIAMLQETANSAATALTACEAQLDRLTVENDKLLQELAELDATPHN
jgi:hypothetical protein